MLVFFSLNFYLLFVSIEFFLLFLGLIFVMILKYIESNVLEEDMWLFEEMVLFI